MLTVSLLLVACGDDKVEENSPAAAEPAPVEEGGTPSAPPFKVVATCEVGYEPEGIALYKGHLFIANTGGYAEQEFDHDLETTVSIVNAATMTVERVIDTGIPNLYGEMSQSGRYLCLNSPGDYYETPPCGLILDCEKALNGEDCFVVFNYPATYNTTTLDGNFLAIGSAFSFLTSEYEFSQLTINPRTMIETGGQSGLEQKLPGTLKSDFMGMSQPYGIYVNPYTGYIYGTDAGSFEGAGYLYQWSPEGALLGKHKVYINPGHFLALPIGGASGPEAERLIVCNEGIWQADNGCLSYFENGSVFSNHWFRDKNGLKLGDTPNDIIQVNDNLIAIAVNWSNIVQFISPDGKAVAATEDIPNNRRLCSDGQYVYVTSYGHECETINGTVYFDKGFVAKINIGNYENN
jgi:DNA-binding beta-propeller fold protein YncE